MPHMSHMLHPYCLLLHPNVNLPHAQTRRLTAIALSVRRTGSGFRCGCTSNSQGL